MSEYLSLNPLREEFLNNDEEYRYAYAEDFLNTYIATQIKVLRDQRGKMTQKEIAEAIGTQQPGIARLENVNYSKWKVETLKKIARALGVRLKITFETFGSLLDEDANFSRETLERPSFEEDPAFQEDEESVRPLFSSPLMLDIHFEVTEHDTSKLLTDFNEGDNRWGVTKPTFAELIPAVIPTKGKGTGEDFAD